MMLLCMVLLIQRMLVKVLCGFWIESSFFIRWVYPLKVERWNCSIFFLVGKTNRMKGDKLVEENVRDEVVGDRLSSDRADR